MAVVLEGICVIVPIELVDFKPGGPAAFRRASAWHDEHLYCETVLPAGEASLWVDGSARHGWEIFVAKTAQARWKVFCVASSGLGLHKACDWAEYDPVNDAVWRLAYPKGEAFGGAEQLRQLRAQLAAARASAEASYARMYDSRSPRDERDDAMGFLSQAMRAARLLGDEATLAEVKTRYDHVGAVYRSQFRL
jgi:hypothetical protein